MYLHSSNTIIHDHVFLSESKALACKVHSEHWLPTVACLPSQLGRDAILVGKGCDYRFGASQNHLYIMAYT